MAVNTSIDGLDSQFTTEKLVAAVNLVKDPSTMLLDMAFPTTINSNSKYAAVEIFKGNQKIAPYVLPCNPAVPVITDPRTVTVVEHSYIRMEQPICCDDPISRPFGSMLLSQELTPMQRVEAHTLMRVTILKAMWKRRLNQMAFQSLLAGKLTIMGPQVPTSVVDFRRTASHTITAAASAKWNQPGTDPMADVRLWAKMTAQDGNSYARQIVMDSTTFQVFRNNALIKERFVNGSMIQVAGNSLTNNLPNDQGDDIVFQGTVDGFKIYTMDGVYEDGTGTLVPYFGAGQVLAMGDVQGIRSFGVIRDERAAYGSPEFFLKSYYKEETGMRIIDLASSPMLIPSNIDATVVATVL
jgi:Phage major capsid protein E